MRIPTKLVNAVVNATLLALKTLKIDSPNRLVVAASPLLASLSGAAMVLVARYLPTVGSHFSQTEFTGLFITGALICATALLKWLHGWQAHEKQQSQQQSK